MIISPPDNPVAAVTHPDPYPYYAELVARQPLYHDETLGMWVASSAAAVSAVLTSDLCQVRPPAEPVPKALLGSPAGDLFGRFVRMNDGTYHAALKPAVAATMQVIEAAQVAEQGRQWARFLLDARQPQTASRYLHDFAFHLPVYVIASLLGVPQDKLYHTALWMGEFVRCLAPGSNTEQIERGKVAAGHLLALLRALLSAPRADPSSSLLLALAEQTKNAGGEDEERIIANGIGLVFKPTKPRRG